MSMDIHITQLLLQKAETMREATAHATALKISWPIQRKCRAASSCSMMMMTQWSSRRCHGAVSRRLSVLIGGQR